MIKAQIVRDKSSRRVTGFTVRSHGEPIVCAAVSMLVINTVNGIEAFAGDKFHYDYEESGGYFSFSLVNPEAVTPEADVLLKVLALGLESTKAQYPKAISIRNIDKKAE